MVTTQHCMDCIQVTGIRGYGYTGFFEAEQTLGQWFEVDVTLWLDLEIASQSDRLEDTLNYAQVVETVQSLLQTARCQLLERLAAAIVTTLLAGDSRIEQVQVRLTKLTPPIPHFSGQVAVEMRRQRPAIAVAPTSVAPVSAAPTSVAPTSVAPVSAAPPSVAPTSGQAMGTAQ